MERVTMSDSTSKQSEMQDIEQDADADSDLEDLQGDIAKMDQSIRQFLADQHGPTIWDQGTLHDKRLVSSRGRKLRGPRKAAKPRGDITARLSKVNRAFLDGDYSTAVDLAIEIIRINAETHQAWIALASIFREQGEFDRSLSAMVYAAHLRPKDFDGWMQCAAFALDDIHGGDDEDDGDDNDVGNLHTARLCYSAALRIRPENIDARFGKASVCHKQGHLAAAISAYSKVLERQPRQLNIVRRLVEACLDNKHTESAIITAIKAYGRFFSYETVETGANPPVFSWHDIGIYVDLLASTSNYEAAVSELRRLGRWLLHRGHEYWWDDMILDDREWDIEDDRRALHAAYHPEQVSIMPNARLLPLDFRLRLAIYRLRLNHLDEASRHLSLLDPTSEHMVPVTEEFPYLVVDLASELALTHQVSVATEYLLLVRKTSDYLESSLLLQIGRCYLTAGDDVSAEECLLAVIDMDEDNIEARVELANIYEKAKENEEALILTAEAIALQNAQNELVLGESPRRSSHPKAPLIKLPSPIGSRSDVPARGRLTQRAKVVPQTKIFKPRRYRRKRLVGDHAKLEDEKARATLLLRQYERVQTLKAQIQDGHTELVPAWMQSAEELVHEFRCLKKFYSWDKYFHNLGATQPGTQPVGTGKPDTVLTRMYDRLSRVLEPGDQKDQMQQESSSTTSTHQGIPFDDWLTIFLDYAIALASGHRREEAYQICEAARNSNVFQADRHDFLIHVAFSVCAIYTSDEERCIRTARHLMRDASTTDSYRFFALMSVICQSPVSWYTSGPTQKFLLRQIKAMDARDTHNILRPQESSEPINVSGLHPRLQSSWSLDICLLVLYGHVLFASTSYSYAISYFLRARSIDPSNALVNFSLGLAYIHYGLKRQSTNRQYLLLQGQVFLRQYIETAQDEFGSRSRPEILFNVGRMFQLLGIQHLALKHYGEALSLCASNESNDNVSIFAYYNSMVSALLTKNNQRAIQLMKEGIRL